MEYFGHAVTAGSRVFATILRQHVFDLVFAVLSELSCPPMSFSVHHAPTWRPKEDLRH